MFGGKTYHVGSKLRVTIGFFKRKNSFSSINPIRTDVHGNISGGGTVISSYQTWIAKLRCVNKADLTLRFCLEIEAYKDGGYKTLARRQFLETPWLKPGQQNDLVFEWFDAPYAVVSSIAITGSETETITTAWNLNNPSNLNRRIVWLYIIVLLVCVASYVFHS